MKPTLRRNVALVALTLAVIAGRAFAQFASAATPVRESLSLLRTACWVLPPPPPENYAAEFSDVLKAVQGHFWDTRLTGQKWNKTTESYRARLKDVKTKAEFTTLVNQMLDELHASHTAYFNNDDVEFSMIPAVMSRDMQEHRVEHIGVMGTSDGSAFLVSAVLDGGPAQKAGIRAGDTILSADGEVFTTAGSFRGKAGKQVQLSIKRPGSTSTEIVSVTPVKENQLRAFLNATRTSARVIDIRGKHIGYMHLWTMANDNFKDALDSIVLKQLHDTDGLILDLRDGYGGIPFGYIDVFTRPDVSWETQYRGSQVSVTHTGYNKPIVVLINEGTRSAKEFFSYQFKSSHRALLVGTQTAGAFLGAGSFPISDTGLLEMAIVGLRVDGIKLEHDGVKPDVEVDAKDPYTDKDQQMKVAMDRLMSQITQAQITKSIVAP